MPKPIPASSENSDHDFNMNRFLFGSEVGFWFFDGRTGQMRADDHWLSALGYSKAEIAETLANWHEFIHPDDLPTLKARLNDIMQERSAIYLFVHRIRTKWGDWRWFLSRGKIDQRDADNRPILLAGICLDITPQKLAEEALTAERDLSLALNSVTDLSQALNLCLETALRVSGMDCGGIYLIDEEGALSLAVTVGLSDSFTEAVRYFPAQTSHARLVMAGTPVYKKYDEIVPDLKTERQIEGLHCIGVLPVQHDRRIIGAMNIASHMLSDFPEQSRDALEIIAGQIGAAIVRIRAQAALAKTTETLNAVLGSVPLPTFALDIEGRVQLIWNTAAERILGWTHDEALGRFLPTVPTDSLSKFEDFLGAIRAGQTLNGIEFQHMRKDGTLASFAAYAAPICDRNGKVTHGVVVLLDLTERHQFEEKLRQTNKLEAIGRLTGGIAHDFNNLLSPILGYSELILDGLQEQDILHEHITQIRDAAKRAAELTGQLLAFSRKQVLNMRVMNLNATIADFDKMLRRLLGENIRFETRLAPGLGNINGDPSKIQQILLNLCVNSRDAMPESGSLIIETDEVIVDQTYASMHPDVKIGPHITLVVSDTGCGMTPVVVKQLFEPFFTTKETGKGTGLGLPMVYGIVKQHGGNIFVYSEPDKGSVFKILFPRIELNADLPSCETPAPSKGEGIVMVVEDSEMVRKLVIDVLSAHGYKVLAAENAEDAMRLAEKYRGKIDLLLTDVIMPRINGKELHRKLCIQRPDLKALYMSGYTSEVINKQGMLEPGVLFIQKPFMINTLLLKIEEAMGGFEQVHESKG